MRENYRNDPVFQKIIMSNPEIAEALKHPDEQRKFHQLIMEKAKDGKVDFHDMQQIAFDITHGKVDDISNAEGRRVAAAIIPDSSRRYRASDPEPAKKTVSAAKDDKIAPAPEGDPAGKPAKVLPAYYVLRARGRQASYQSSLSEDKKRSYFDTLRKIISGRSK